MTEKYFVMWIDNELPGDEYDGVEVFDTLEEAHAHIEFLKCKDSRNMEIKLIKGTELSIGERV